MSRDGKGSKPGLIRIISLPNASQGEEQSIGIRASESDQKVLDSFFESPLLNVVGVDSKDGWWFLSRLNHEGYASAPFLDHRSFVFSEDEHAAFKAAPSLIRERYHAVGSPRRSFSTIFHVGHCGSTLLANLLGERSDTHVLREPPAFRWLANHQSEFERRGELGGWVDMVGGVVSRTFSPQHDPVVKASSWCHPLMEAVLELDGDNRCVFLYTGLREFLVRFLGKRRGDMEKSALKSFDTFSGELPLELREWERMEGWQRGTLAWLSKIWSCDRAKNTKDGDRVLPLSFGQLLKAPEQSLALVSSFLQLREADAPDEALASWATYAKDRQRGFSIEDEHQRLRNGEREHSQEIEQGLELSLSLIRKGLVSQDWTAHCDEASWD